MWLAAFGIVNQIFSSTEFAQATAAAYTMIILVWSVLFNEKVRMREAELRFLWGTEVRNCFQYVVRLSTVTCMQPTHCFPLYHVQLLETFEQPRREFMHSKDVEFRYDPETRRMAFLPKSRVRIYIKGLLGAPVILVWIGIAILADILCHTIKELEYTVGSFEIPMNLVGTILNVVLLKVLEKMYSVVAERLTVWENHRTESSHESSRIIKTFIFDAVNNYFT
eukprot:COSAG02_NODE_4898_length_4851_cov_5.166667_4_plen_223_part_00